MNRRTMASALALVLAGCGDAGSGGGATAAGWKPMDACAIMGREKVAQTLGIAVTSAELQAVRDGSIGNGDLYSQCTFKLADGQLLVFGTAQAPGDPDVAATKASLRSQMKMVTDDEPVELSDVGKGALWQPSLQALYVLLGDGRWASATMTRFGGAPVPADQVRAAEIKLMRAIGA